LGLAPVGDGSVQVRKVRKVRKVQKVRKVRKVQKVHFLFWGLGWGLLPGILWVYAFL